MGACPQVDRLLNFFDAARTGKVPYSPFLLAIRKPVPETRPLTSQSKIRNGSCREHIPEYLEPSFGDSTYTT